MMTTAPASFAVANSPSGGRVKVAGRSVHHQSWGSVKPGHPTLWLENGWFGQLLGWGALPELLCQDGWCVRAYDRGNYGWSQGAAEDRIADRAEAGQLREADIGDYINQIHKHVSGSAICACCSKAPLTGAPTRRRWWP